MPKILYKKIEQTKYCIRVFEDYITGRCEVKEIYVESKILTWLISLETSHWWYKKPAQEQ